MGYMAKKTLFWGLRQYNVAMRESAIFVYNIREMLIKKTTAISEDLQVGYCWYKSQSCVSFIHLKANIIADTERWATIQPLNFISVRIDFLRCSCQRMRSRSPKVSLIGENEAQMNGSIDGARRDEVRMSKCCTYSFRCLFLCVPKRVFIKRRWRYNL